MSLSIKSEQECRWDIASLGEVMLRLDPGEGRIHTTRSFRVCEGGGEYNVARGLRRCFRMRGAIVTAICDNPVGRLLEDCMLQGGLDLDYVKWAPFDGIGRDCRVGLNFTERGYGVRAAVGCSDRGLSAACQMKPGDVVLLENVRFHKEEEKNDPEFAKALASLAELYVNDAFGTAHRAHASTALMAEYFSPENKMFGYLMGKEVAAVDKVMKEMVRPFTAIMGGSKVSSKIDIIENLLTKVDNLIIAGGMTYTFTKALGGKIGNSICEDDKLDLALELINKAKANHVNLVLAVDALSLIHI
mgnify:CR=1 FL=1